jgi:hypothetical protein
MLGTGASGAVSLSQTTTKSPSPSEATFGAP